MCQIYLNINSNPQPFTGKERDSETGLSYFGARYYDSDLMTAWLSVDPMADKYPGLSPYAYCAWNPIRLVDPNGEEIDISTLYDKNGKCKYEFIEKALKSFAKTKLGSKELSKYAKGGQEILGIKFNNDGEYHLKGVNLAFGGETLQPYYSGDMRQKIDNNQLEITINLSNVNEVKSVFETICHEIFIHARKAVSDYYDDNTINHSYLAPYLVKYVNEQGKTNDAYINAEHCQFAWYDKNSQDDFIKTMRTQYPKSSNDEILKIIESGFGTNRINLKR